MKKNIKNFDAFIDSLTKSLDELDFINIVGFYDEDKFELTDEKDWGTDDHIYLNGDKTYLVPRNIDLNKLAFNIMETYDDRIVCPPQVFVGVGSKIWEDEDKFSVYKYVCVSWAGE